LRIQQQERQPSEMIAVQVAQHDRVNGVGIDVMRLEGHQR